MAKKAGTIFGPLNFENSSFGFELLDSETKCILCEDSFNLHLRLDIFLCHIFDVHKVVIEDVQNIKNLPEYITYWRNQFKQNPIEQIIPSVKVHDNGEHYFLISSLLEADKQLRHKLTLEYVMKVHEFERTDESFQKQCLFCKLQFEGSRQGYLEHLNEKHNLHLGHSQNLVFIEELINIIEHKLQTFTCIFCEGVFPDRNVMKEHMRKKLHKRINPSDSHYDKFYIVNYLEVGKSWKVLEQEVDKYAHSPGFEENGDKEYSDWNEKDVKITCLFCEHTDIDINMLCNHMIERHNFDFAQMTALLDFYQKIKLVNFVRKMIHSHVCPYCEHHLECNEQLLYHMSEMDHFKMPSVSTFDQPEYYFPTYENDAFLYMMDDVED